MDVDLEREKAKDEVLVALAMAREMRMVDRDLTEVTLEEEEDREETQKS